LATLTKTTPGSSQFTAVFNGNVALGELGNTSQQVAAKVAGPALFAVGSGANGPPQVNVYRQDGALLASFLAYDASFRGGVSVATADVNGDGVDDIITVARVPKRGGG